MNKKSCLTTMIIFVLIVSGLSVLATKSDGTSNSSNDTIAQHVEMTQPTDTEEPRDITEDLTYYEFSYSYDMEYDVPPKEIILNVEGDKEKTDYDPEYSIAITRPDGEEINRVIESKIDKKATSFERTNYFGKNLDSRDKIYKWAKKVADPTDVQPSEIDPVKIIFSKKNEDILADPEPLTGEYKFKVMMTGKNIDFSYGLKETCLFIMSEESTEVRNLEGNYENEEVNLEWDKPKDVGGSEIIQYNIYRATTMYNYVCIDTVGPNKTEYVDDFGEKNVFSHYKGGFDGDVLFYRVAAVNKDNSYYIKHINNGWSLSEIPVQEGWRTLSLQEVVHIPLLYESKKSAKSYKWVMDYSEFTEEDFENRLDRDNQIMDITGVKINELTGGDVFFYDVNYLEDEGGKRKYEYEGGFYSKGKADIEIGSTTSPSSFEINVHKSWIRFSGNIWAKEISTEGYEGLSITKQTIKSEGRIKSSVNGTYDFEFYNEDMHWETSKKVDIEWDLDLTLDYLGNNSWTVNKQNNIPIAPASYEFNYSGSLNAQVDIESENNHDYSEKDVDKNIDKQFSESSLNNVLSVGGLYSEFTRREFTMIIGASRVGYTLTFSQTFDRFSMDQYSSEWAQFNPIVHPFRSNCQAYDFSIDKLYRHKCLDPMVIPGLGSLIGTEFKRSEATFQKVQVENLIKEILREEISHLEPGVNKSAYRKYREDELKREIWGAIFTGNAYILDQQQGPLGNEYVARSVSSIEPLGYFGSKPADEGDMKSFEDDKEKFFENQMYGKDEKDGNIPGFTIGLLLISVLFVLICRYRN